jgi:hypothetical protein
VCSAQEASSPHSVQAAGNHWYHWLSKDIPYRQWERVHCKSCDKALREMIPHIYAVTGRPRCPSDQVSVESMNMLVKRILGTLLTEHFHGRKTYKIKDRQKVTLQATRVIHACKKESLFFFANKLDNVLVQITLVV